MSGLRAVGITPAGKVLVESTKRRRSCSECNRHGHRKGSPKSGQKVAPAVATAACKVESPIERMLAMFVAIGSAHAGEPLTPDELVAKLQTDQDFMRRFNGPVPAEVAFPDEATAALAVTWQSMAVKP